MTDSPHLIPPEAAMAAGKETILIVASEERQVQRLRRELQPGGYRLLTAVGSADARALLSTRRIQLVMVSAHKGMQITEQTNRKLPGRSSKRSEKKSEKRSTSERSPEPEGYRLCRNVKDAAGESPVLLISSLWVESALSRSLGTGADYFLFAPIQPSDLLRAIRETLLNGPVEEPDGGIDVKVIHADRTHSVAAGRCRLARLGFSIFEELRQCRAALSWSQGEAQALHRKLRRYGEPSHQSLPSPSVAQGLAHDFSNLLETVSAASTVLRSGPSQPQPYRDAMDAALAQAGVLLTTLRNWTEWGAKVEEDLPNSATVDLNLTAHEVLDAALLALRAPNIRVSVQLEGLPRVWSSKPLLMRILSNLVWNAVEAMPEGGRLSFLGYLQRNRVVVEVSDTGVGMASTNQMKIFQSQHSTKQGHAGIGLMLVHRLVHRAGGDIAFVSQPGRGSTFALSFPEASTHTPEAEASRAEGRGVTFR